MPGAVPRVVLDTQLVVRGIIGRRKSAAVALFDFALERVRMVAVASPLLLEEYDSVLRLPEVRRLTDPPLDDDLIQRAIRYIVQRFTVVTGSFKDMDKVPDDVRDNPLVEAALEGAAEVIVSDDIDLLSLKVVKVSGFHPVQIYAPGPFLKFVIER